MLLIGAVMLLLGMGMNLQYALDDYGLAENKAVNQVLAQITGSTETSNFPGDDYPLVVIGLKYAKKCFLSPYFS